MTSCPHNETVIWEPHLAGARKCKACGMVYNPNMSYAGKDPWFFEPPSERERIKKLLDVLKKVDASWNGGSLWRGFPMEQLKTMVRKAIREEQENG